MPRMRYVMPYLVAATLFLMVQAHPLPAQLEPNESSASAYPVALGVPVSGLAVDPLSDQDWFTFSLGAGADVSIAVRSSEPDADLRMRLYDAALTLLAEDDASGYGDMPFLAESLAAGQHYLQIVEDGQDALVASYELLVLTPAADANEPNDASNTATTPVPPVAYSDLSIFPAGDVDWFKYEALDDSYLEILLEGWTGQAQIVLRNQLGLPVWSASAPAGSPDVALKRNVQAGLYYWTVADGGGGAPPVRYDLSFRATTDSDAFEPDDTPLEATLIYDGMLLENRSLPFGTEEDWYKVTLGASSDFYAEGRSTGAGVQLDVFDAAEQPLAGLSGVGRVEGTLAAGDYYIRATGAGGAPIADYSFFYSRLSAYPLEWDEPLATPPWPARAYAAAASSGGSLWLLGGEGAASSGPGTDALGDAWLSEDGSAWTEAAAQPWAARAGASAVSLDGAVYLIGGQSTGGMLHDLWKGEDAATSWTLLDAAAPWTARRDAAVAVLDGKIWLAGGFDGVDALDDVWSWSPEAGWTQTAVSAPWSARSLHALVAFGGQLWVIGGYSPDDDAQADVWSSPDGATWTQRKTYAPWGPKAEFAAAEFSGRLLVAAGLPPLVDGVFADAWHSTDGSSWVRTQSSSPTWTPREATGLLHDDRLWLLGGRAVDGTFLAEAWRSEPEPSAPNILNDAHWILSDLTLAWEPSAAATIYHVQLARDAAFSDLAVFRSVAASESETVFTGLTNEQTYFARVRAGHESRLYSDWCEPTSFTVDATPPTAVLAVNGSSASVVTELDVLISIDAEDPGARPSGLNRMRFREDGAAWTAWEDFAPTRAWTLTPGDGEHVIEAEIEDLAGNGAAGQPVAGSVILDRSAPTVLSITPLQPGPVGPGTVSFRVTFSEPVSGFDDPAADVSRLTGGGASVADVAINSETAAVYRVDLLGVAGDGSVGVTIPGGVAQDAAGNPTAASVPSEMVMLDSTPPEVLSLTASPTSAAPGVPVDVYLEVSEELGADPNVSVGGFSMTYLGYVDGRHHLRVFVSSFLNEGPVEIRAEIEDLAGNTTLYTTSDALIIDATAPHVERFAVTPGVATLDQPLSIRVELDEATPLPSTVTILGRDAQVTSASTGVFEYAWRVEAADAESTPRITVRSQDVAGNIAVAYYEAQFTIDQTPPQSEVLPLRDVITTSTFTVSWATTDTERVELYWTLDGGAPALAGVFPVSTSSTVFDVSSYEDGVYGFYTVGVDANGLREAVPAEPDASAFVAAQQPIRGLIHDFYLQILGRAPEGAAADQWRQGYFEYAVDFDIDVRFIPREMARIFFLSEEYAAMNKSDEEFIRDCYNVFLQREPSESDLAAWLAGEWNRAQVMTLFAESDEFAARIAELYPGMEGDPTRNFVTIMYIGLLDRLVDEGGLGYFAEQMNLAADKRLRAYDMAIEVFESEEFLAKNPAAEDYVVRLYRAFLGRFPNDAEIAYWAGQIDAGAETVESAADYFSRSPEFTQRLERFFGTQ